MDWIFAILLPVCMLFYPFFFAIIFALIVRRYPKKIILSYLASTFGIPLIVTALIWSWALLNFKGQCGGWLGETSTCKLPQYALEQLMWSAFAFTTPIAVSIFVNSVFLAYKLYQAKKKETKA